MEEDRFLLLIILQPMKQVNKASCYVTGFRIILVFISSIAPGAVFNFTAEPILTSVLLTWSPPQEPNGVIIAYEVTYSVNGSKPNIMNTTNTIQILRLALNTEVSNISVRAYTSVGPGDASKYLSVFTPEDPTPCEFLAVILLVWSKQPVQH